jgi:phytoene dehydrogenase-like protein
VAAPRRIVLVVRAAEDSMTEQEHDALLDLVAPAPHPNDCSGPGSLARARREWAERRSSREERDLSKYGRLWQEASDLRDVIKETLLRPLPNDFRPADVRGKTEAVDRLVAQWEALEAKMAATDD